MENNLIPVNTNIVALFTDGGLDPILNEVKKKVDEFEPDVESGTGRKEIASFAYKIAQSKIFIEKAGKELVSKQKAEIKLIDNERKRSRDFLDEQRDRARLPLTEWEETEKKAIAEEAARIEYEADHTEALELHALYLKEQELEELKAKIAREEEEKREKEEYDQKLAVQKAREERIKKEAAAQAKKEAEEVLATEKEKTIRLEVEAKAKKERVEQAKIDAAKKAEREKKEAVVKAMQEAEDKAKVEIEEAERKAAEEKKIADRKAAHHKHRKKINNEAVAGFIDIGCSKKESEDLVTAIAKGLIPNVTINY